MSPPPRTLSALAVALCAALLAYSYSLPTVTFEAMTRHSETYSIWGGIESLWRAKNWILAPVVFLFSMIFPVLKLLALGSIVAGRWSGRRERRLLEWLHILGKWSMLDVFIIAVFVAAVQLDLRVGGKPTGLFLAKATSRPGIHWFALAIAASMATTHFIAGSSLPRPRVREGARLRSAGARLLSLGRTAGLVAVWILPLLEVKRRLEMGFVQVDSSNQVLLWTTTRRLGNEGEFLLSLALLLPVIILPGLRALCSLRLAWLGGRNRWALRLARGLDAWAMVDVFGLGLLIVQVKLAELTTTTLRIGFWCTLLAAVLALADSWRLRRICAPAEDRALAAFPPRAYGQTQ